MTEELRGLNMALVTCKDCGHPFSDSAHRCPRCGHDYWLERIREAFRQFSRFGWGLFWMVVIGFVIFLAYAFLNYHPAYW